ncbi:MAG: hypothetical protein C0481_06425 [Phenylobacterium sp.]|uniref:hypothetical protein n=1 Tax=Phenylobacterium sp. TaxID=1871053 RepID=UPI0025DF7A72|nr:hypothetical protein [Phenylobacterium sp.]MBA4011485.1 hypothetical protein [Phenylobacterium sp.]
MGKAFGWSIVVVFALFGAGVLWLSMPIFFFPLLAPAVSDVLQRPAVVPMKGARADYHWKGSGLSWAWCEDVGGGSVHWDAYGGQVKASLALEPMCDRFDGSRNNNRWDASYSTAAWEGVLFHSPGQQREEACQTVVSADKVDAYVQLARTARGRTANRERAAVLSEFERRLLAIDLRALEAAPNDLDACRAGEGGAS